MFRTPFRVQAGEWLGPWVLCRALEVAVNAARPLGIAAHVLAEPGGGAPTVRLPLFVLTGMLDAVLCAVIQPHGPCGPTF